MPGSSCHCPCPWSHIALDFITDITIIPFILDWVSLCLIPLLVLPTALKTAELIFNHVIRYYGFPEDSQWQGCTVYIQVLVQLYGEAGSFRESHIGLPSSIQQASRACQWGNHPRPKNLLFRGLRRLCSISSCNTQQHASHHSSVFLSTNHPCSHGTSFPPNHLLSMTGLMKYNVSRCWN